MSRKRLRVSHHPGGCGIGISGQEIKAVKIHAETGVRIAPVSGIAAAELTVLIIMNQVAGIFQSDSHINGLLGIGSHLKVIAVAFMVFVDHSPGGMIGILGKYHGRPHGNKVIMHAAFLGHRIVMLPGQNILSPPDGIRGDAINLRRKFRRLLLQSMAIRL